MKEKNIERFFKLNDEYKIKPFESTNKDLNGFLFNKAKDFHKGLLATTYIIENDEKTIAYFNIFNDSLRLEEVQFESNSKKKKFPRTVLNTKRNLATYPAIKIGRLAVCKEEKGYGRMIMQWIIDFAIKLNEQVGCKFILVDSKAKTTGFYEKFNFSYFNDKDKNSATRHMYLDIAPYTNTNKELDSE